MRHVCGYQTARHLRRAVKHGSNTARLPSSLYLEHDVNVTGDWSLTRFRELIAGTLSRIAAELSPGRAAEDTGVQSRGAGDEDTRSRGRGNPRALAYRRVQRRTRRPAWLSRARRAQLAVAAHRRQRARTRAGVLILILSAGITAGAYVEYRRGVPSPYQLPNSWGQVHLLVPQGATDCRGRIILDTTSKSDDTQRLTMNVSFTNPANLTGPPSVGLVMDLDAQPPDYFWPLPPETLTIEGEAPTLWNAIADFYGFYAGHLWLLRAPAIGNEYKFTIMQPPEQVGDHRTLEISGKVVSDGNTTRASLTVRPRGNFEMRHGSRVTYILPTFLNFQAVPKLRIRGFDEPNEVSRTDVSACEGSGTRESFLLTHETFGNAQINPRYRIDSVSPPVATDTLSWSTTGNIPAPGPVVSIVDRVAEQDQQRALFLSGVLVGVAAAVAPIGLPLLPWSSVLRLATTWRRWRPWRRRYRHKLASRINRSRGEPRR